jgi:hypothetical protein
LKAVEEMEESNGNNFDPPGFVPDDEIMENALIAFNQLTSAAAENEAETLVQEWDENLGEHEEVFEEEES